MIGWVKIHRQLLEWEWYDDTNTFRLFIHLLLKANHKEKKYRGMLLQPGTILTGRDLLAKELKLSSQQIRTSLTKLKSTNEITIKGNSLGSVIQVVKWLDYQVATNEITTEQPKDNQRVTTNKKVKKEEKKEEGYASKEASIKLFEIFWSKYPNKTGKKKCLEKFITLPLKDMRAILETVNDFANYKQFEDYTHPMPITYLNQERWTDVIPKAKEKPTAVPHWNSNPNY